MAASCAQGSSALRTPRTTRVPSAGPRVTSHDSVTLEDEDVDMTGLARDLMSSGEARVRIGEPMEEPYRVASAVSPVSVDDGEADMFDEAAQPVIIFDWDDTLLASSWLARNRMTLDEPHIVPSFVTKPMSELGASVCTLLTAALERGPVVIITNAETGWVEMSAHKFMPEVLPLLRKVRVISARSTYESQFPDSPSDWKVAAFTQELTASFGTAKAIRGMRRAAPRRAVISFGDSVYERTAVHAAATRLKSTFNVVTKSVKFVERPSVEQVRRQVDLVAGCLHDICTHAGNLDLMLTIQLLEQHVEAAAAQKREAARRQAAGSATE